MDEFQSFIEDVRSLGREYYQNIDPILNEIREVCGDNPLIPNDYQERFAQLNNQLVKWETERVEPLQRRYETLSAQRPELPSPEVLFGVSNLLAH